LRYVKDLLVTDEALIRGHVATGGRRLTDFLNSTPRTFLDVDEATVADHRTGEGVSYDSLLVRIDEVLLAHEMVEAGGDQVLKALADAGRDLAGIRLELASGLRLTVSGRVITRLLAREDLGEAHFFVVDTPVVSGFPSPDGAAPAPLRSLSYVIVNRNRVALAFRTAD
jgi:hypothetical protein